MATFGSTASAARRTEASWSARPAFTAWMEWSQPCLGSLAPRSAHCGVWGGGALSPAAPKGRG
eukprot:12295702-Alexandrium_andersonii.AAC.1